MGWFPQTSYEENIRFAASMCMATGEKPSEHHPARELQSVFRLRHMIQEWQIQGTCVPGAFAFYEVSSIVCGRQETAMTNKCCIEKPLPYFPQSEQLHVASCR